MTKKIFLLRSLSQEPCIIWLSFMVHMCKMIISPGVFFNFKILIFQVVRGLKGQKMTQNVENFCFFCTLYFRNHISHDLYLWYTWMYKRIISPGNFFHFLWKFWFYFIWFWFSGSLWGVIKRQKMAKNDKKLSVSLVISGTIHHTILIFGALV